MKLMKSASGKTTVKLSKSDWQSIGIKAGWLNKKASPILRPDDDCVDDPNCDADTLSVMFWFEDMYDTDTLCKAASHPNCPPEALEKATKSRNPEVCQCAAKNPNCPPEAAKRCSDQQGQVMAKKKNKLSK